MMGDRKTFLELKKKEFSERLARKRLNKSKCKQPRYDNIYYAGVAAFEEDDA